MEKTANYQLNQWDAADPIRREDFNADNQKIDAALMEKGNCYIVVGTYTGTGTYGSSAPNTLTFERTPQALFLISGNWRGWCIRGCSSGTIHFGASSASLALTWGDNSLSWYGYDSAEKQLNEKGYKCYYCAFLTGN